MAKVKSDTLHVKGIDVGIYTEDYRNEYISLTDIARFRNSDDPRFAIQNWMRNRNTIEFLGLWESLHNPNFNRVQFDTFRTEAGLNRFVMTPSKWVENTGSIGITAKAGRYGGTYAHSDIAMEFASWISAEFKLYLMKDYRRLKFDENSRLSLSWNLNREISKLNYRVHTNAIQQNLLPPDLTREQQSFVYADEADMLNVALFGLTAAQWRSQNQGCKGNIRDYASLQQLLVLANMASYNALLIEQKLPQTERLQMLRQMAVRQLQVLSSLDVTNLPSLPPGIGND